MPETRTVGLCRDCRWWERSRWWVSNQGWGICELTATDEGVRHEAKD